MKRHTVPLAGTIALLAAGGAFAQAPAAPTTDVVSFEPATFHFVAAEMSIAGKTVKGAPYSGEATTETIQTLADGNRISRKTAAPVYRDGEGRTRREQSFPAIGPWAAAGETPPTVFIDDPVGGFHYILNTGQKIARKIPIRTDGEGLHHHFGKTMGPVHANRMEGSTAGVRVRPRAALVVERMELAHGAKRLKDQDVKTESLGEKLIEGVKAEGTRTTATIPAGTIGNDRAIEIVSERWHSPELQVTVMSTHSDPRMGQTTYRLTKLQRGEPVRTLFEVPPDYKVIEGPPPPPPPPSGATTETHEIQP
ncbi:MAG: hypothetical protein ACRD7E_01120 [Bryobacteraceae bacterium]